MSIKHKIQHRLKTLQRFGISAVICDLIDRVGKVTCGLRIVDLVALKSDVASIEADSNFEFRFLEASEIEAFAQDPTNDLGIEMATRIRNGHDHCFAALEEGRLAAYGWYATGCIEPEHNHDTAMSYPSSMAYMYKGFTHPDFRGNRLHGAGMALALQNLEPKGVTSLVSTVDWTNHASLKSCDRLGYERLGRMVITGKDKSRLIRAPKTASALGVQLGPDATRRPAS